MSLDQFRTFPGGGGSDDETYQDSGTSNKYFLIKSLEAKPVLTAPKCGNTEVGNLIPHQRSTLFFRIGHRYLDLRSVCSLPVVYYEVNIHGSRIDSQGHIRARSLTEENGVSR